MFLAGSLSERSPFHSIRRTAAIALFLCCFAVKLNATGGCIPSRMIAMMLVATENARIAVGVPTPLLVRVLNDCGDAVSNANVAIAFSNGDPAMVLTSAGSGGYVGTWLPADTTRQFVAIFIRVTRSPFPDAAEMVTVRLIPALEITTISRSDLVFTVREGTQEVQSQQLEVLGGGRWSAGAVLPGGGSWLTVRPAAGTNIFDVGVSMQTLRTGTYQGMVVARRTDEADTSKIAAVHLQVVPADSAPSPVLSQAGLVFSATAGGAAPVAQTVTLANAGGGRLTFRAGASTTDGRSWLAVTPASGEAPADLRVQALNTGLAAGVYRGTVRLDIDGAGTRDISVLLVITPAVAAALARAVPAVAPDCVPAQLQVLSTALPSGFAAVLRWPVPLVVRALDNCSQNVSGAEITVSFPDGGDSMRLTDLRNGWYSGTWTPTVSRDTRLVLNARKGTLQAVPTELAGRVSPSELLTPLISLGGIVHAAAYEGASASGGIISIFGVNLATSTASGTIPLPTELAGVHVRVGTQEVPLFYVSPGQINAQLPLVATSPQVPDVLSVAVVSNGRVSPPSTVTVSAFQPGIFFFKQQEVSRGAVLDAMNRLVDGNNPAVRGSTVQVFATGLGATDPLVAPGQAAPLERLAKTVAPVSATVGAAEATVTFAGLAPGFAGLYQVNVEIPTSVAAGDVPLRLRIGDTYSNPVMLPIR